MRRPPPPPPPHLEQVGERRLVVEQLVGGEGVHALGEVALQQRQHPLPPHLRRGRSPGHAQPCCITMRPAINPCPPPSLLTGAPPPRPTSATTSSCTSTSTRPPRRDTSASFTNSSECAWALRWACRLSDSSQSCCSNQAGLPTSSMSKARRRSAMRSASAAVRAVACDGAGWRRSGSSGGPRRWSACSAIQTHLVQPSRGGRGLAATSQQGLHRGDVSYAGGHRLQLVVEINCAHVQLVCRIFGGSTQCQCHAHSHW